MYIHWTNSTNDRNYCNCAGTILVPPFLRPLKLYSDKYSNQQFGCFFLTVSALFFWSRCVHRWVSGHWDHFCFPIHFSFFSWKSPADQSLKYRQRLNYYSHYYLRESQLKFFLKTKLYCGSIFTSFLNTWDLINKTSHFCSNKFLTIYNSTQWSRDCHEHG